VIDETLSVLKRQALRNDSFRPLSDVPLLVVADDVRRYAGNRGGVKLWGNLNMHPGARRAFRNNEERDHASIFWQIIAEFNGDCSA
jgi:hypothetical protein